MDNVERDNYIRGIKRNGVSLTVMHLPDRKNASLCVEYDNEPRMIYPIATFKSAEEVLRFSRAIESMFEEKGNGPTQSRHSEESN